MPQAAIVFDLDGTLIDSAPSLHSAASAMMTTLGLPSPDLATVIGFVGNGVPTLVERCLAWAGKPFSDTAVDVFRRIYDADPVSGVQVFDGVPDLLADLRRAGHPLGLCTNKPEAPTRTLLHSLQLGPFDAIVGGDTLAHRKPHPAPLEHVLEALHRRPQEAFYVGDSLTDWRTAHAAQVPYLHLSLGYENDPKGEIAPVQTFADIPSLHEWLTQRS